MAQLFVLLALLSIVHAAPAADEIKSLPGWTGPLPSPQYSGYLNISSTKHLHYWLVLSENNPATDPVVLWLNGGPGCSSLDGFIYEHGPFYVNPDDYNDLELREYRWCSVANILYLEAPVGVGFSYSTNPSVDYNCTDQSTAADNLAAVQLFFAEFPEFMPNEFYITGESYAGVYVPTLAEAIMNAVAAGTYKGAPLRGIAVGNGCTGDQIGICGFGPQGTYYEWEYLTQLSFIPNDQKTQINNACNWTCAKQNLPNCFSPVCEALMEKAKLEISDINMYDVYGDCVTSYIPEAETGKYVSKAPNRSFFMAPPGGPLACIDSRAASAYFNQPNVMQAIHVRPPGFEWGVCTDAPGWNYTKTVANLPQSTYPALIKNYRVTIYNGDWDACVPYTDNEAWTENMGYPIMNPWHAWKYDSEQGNPDQVAGYAVQYVTNGVAPNSGFQFITVRGGRHEVPESAPGKALKMLTWVIEGRNF
jgi:carboxypeptidase C (cathepsin A)